MIHIYSGITCIRVLNGELNAQNMQYSTHTSHVDVKQAIYYTRCMLMQNMQCITQLACWCKTCSTLHTCHIDAKLALYYTLGMLMQNMQFITYLAC